ncbi:MAG: NAD(P)H-binding protein [Bdellovibrionota bacterium]
MARVAVAGASGFVGRFLIEKLREKHEVYALSRSNRVSSHPNVHWKACDFFSLKQARDALKNIDVAVYLVHSMNPSARLTQGSFEDFDLIAADNFARAAETHQLKQIIYLGGIINETKKLSRHLRSRQEVEEVLKSYPTPVTNLRAGLVIGPEGSSFEILEKLVKRLPMMVLPKWTKTLSQPISVSDVVDYIDLCLLNRETFNKVFDIGGPDEVSYEDLIRKTAETYGKQPFFLRAPIASPEISKLWVRLISGKPKEFVDPLVESLNCRMDKRDFGIEDLFQKNLISVAEAIRKARDERAPRLDVSVEVKEEVKDVRSVQRLPLPKSWSAEKLSNVYLSWLSKFLPIFLRIESVDFRARIYLRFFDLLLLELTRDEVYSSSDRSLLRITGGCLTQVEGLGRLEFREIRGKNLALAAIHDFRPTLPWFIYEWTQAKLHLIVMKAFSVFLSRK